MIKKYLVRPVYANGVQWTGKNVDEIASILKGYNLEFSVGVDKTTLENTYLIISSPVKTSVHLNIGEYLFVDSKGYSECHTEYVLGREFFEVEDEE